MLDSSENTIFTSPIEMLIAKTRNEERERANAIFFQILVEAAEQFQTLFQLQIDAEREECAKIAHEHATDCIHCSTPEKIEKEIRQRGRA